MIYSPWRRVGFRLSSNIGLKNIGWNSFDPIIMSKKCVLSFFQLFSFLFRMGLLSACLIFSKYFFTWRICFIIRREWGIHEHCALCTAHVVSDLKLRVGVIMQCSLYVNSEMVLLFKCRLAPFAFISAYLFKYGLATGAL